MKKIAIILLLPFLFCSCEHNESIDKMTFAKIIGIDATNDGVEVTAGLNLPESTKEDKPKSETYFASSKTLAEGINIIDNITDEKVFYGQVEVVLISEEQARKGIIEILDYFVRTNDFRFDMPIAIVKGLTAKEMILSVEDISNQIKKMFSSNESVSTSGKVTLANLLEMIEDPFHSPFLPFLELKEQGIELKGYCVFEKDSLKEFANEEISTGINWLNQKIKKQIIVKNIEGSDLTLKLSNNKTKINFDGEKFEIDVSFKSEIIQSDGVIHEFDEKVRNQIVIEQNTQIYSTIENTLEFLKENKSDCGNLGKSFSAKKGKEAREFEEDWENEFINYDYVIKINSKVNPSKSASKPIKEKGNE